MLYFTPAKNKAQQVATRQPEAGLNIICVTPFHKLSCVALEE